MNRLLKRQLRRFFGGEDKIPPGLMPLFEQISSAYDDFDHDRLLTERSLEISSQEMSEKNRTLEEAQEALFHARANLIKMLWSLPFGVIMVSEKGHKILNANDAAIKFLGYESPEGLIGQPCHRFICPMEPGQCPVSDRGEAVDRVEGLLICKNGERRPILKSVAIITLDSEKVLVEAFIDISERKRMEQHLLEAKNAAESANRAKSEFLSRVSHEIRTPLHAIIGFAEIIVQISSQEDVKARANIILNESESFLRLINDILDQAKMESGNFDLVYHPFSIKSVVEDVAHMLQPLADRKKLALEVRLAPGIPGQVAGDAYRLRQVLVNLAGNAVKFTEKGFVSLEASLSKTEADKCVVSFQVRDSGIGIPADKLKDIFNPFYQVDSNLDRRYEGSGLGTAISKRLVEQMGGTISCDSVPGEGSVFRFELPFSTRLVSEASSAAVAPAQSGAAVSKEAKDLKILYGEDQEVNRDLAEVQFRQLGLENVTYVGNGAEAVRMCGKCGYDIVFLDLQMPVMDGVEAAAHIRMDCPQVPIVAVTANVNPAVHKQCLESGFNEVLLKPTRITALSSILSKYFHIKPSALPAAGPQYESAGSGSVVDKAEGLALFGGNEMLYKMSLAKFRADALQLISGFGKSLEGGDYESLRKNAHKLAGSAAAVAAKEISALARQLEDGAQSADSAQCGFLVAKLVSFSRAIDADIII